MKDKIIEILNSHEVMRSFPNDVDDIATRILAIHESGKQEEAKERYGEAKVFLAKEWGWDISAMYHATSTMEALRIAAGLDKPTK